MHMYRQQVLKPRHKHHFPKVGAHNSTRMQEMQSEVYVWTWPEHEDITWHIAGVQGQRMSLSLPPPHPTPPHRTPPPQKDGNAEKKDFVPRPERGRGPTTHSRNLTIFETWKN